MILREKAGISCRQRERERETAHTCVDTAPNLKKGVWFRALGFRGQNAVTI